jgi:hypothetical protein
MDAIPNEWIDKLFVCMHQFYGDRWDKQFDKKNLDKFYKTMWKNGLHGLNYDQIKEQLKKCKKHSEHPTTIPPIVTEFYRWAKGH